MGVLFIAAPPALSSDSVAVAWDFAAGATPDSGTPGEDVFAGERDRGMAEWAEENV
jgi:hypothetical protein